MKTHDDLRWDFKQETKLDSVYRQNNNSQPFNEAYVKWLEDKILLANGAEQRDSNCNIPLVSESKLWYVEFKQKGSTHIMSTTSDTSSRDAIERDLLLRDYEMVNIRRVYFR